MGEQATFAINLEGNAPEASQALSGRLEELRARAVRSQEALKDMSTSLRALRGNSSEVTAAKDRLKASIDAEKSSLSAANLELLKAGSSLGRLTQAQKDAAKAANDNAKAQRATGDVLKLIGGPLVEGRDKVKALSEAFEGGITVETALLASTAALTLGIVALGAAAIGAGASLVKLVVTNGDAARSLALSREWIAGSAADSERMGDQIDRLRAKVPLTTAELSKLYETTRAGFDGTRLSGQGILNTVNAIAQASAAGSSKAASKIEEILKRGSAYGRVGIQSGFDPFSGGPGGKGELAGTGLDFKDVAKNIAANLHISIQQAETELRRGRVPIEAAALALRQSAEQAFGGINERKLLSIAEIGKHLGDNLQSLARGNFLEPLLAEFDRLVKLTDAGTTSGYGLKAIFKAIGLETASAAKAGGPLLETMIRTLILDATKFSIEVLRWELRLKGVGGGFADLLFKATQVLHIVKAIADAATFDVSGFTKEIDAFQSAAAARANAAFFGQATAAANAGGTKAAVITAPAHADGGVVARPAHGEFFASVAPGEAIVPRGRSGSVTVGSGAIQISIAAQGGSAGEVAAAISRSSLVAELTKALEDALKTAGVGTQEVPG